MNTTKKLEVKHTVEVIDYKVLNNLTGQDGQRANTELIVRSAQRLISKRGAAIKSLHDDYVRVSKLRQTMNLPELEFPKWALEESTIWLNERTATLNIHDRWALTKHGLKALFGFGCDISRDMAAAARQIWGTAKTFGSARSTVRENLKNAGDTNATQISGMVDEMCQSEQPTKITKVA